MRNIIKSGTLLIMGSLILTSCGSDSSSSKKTTLTNNTGESISIEDVRAVFPTSVSISSPVGNSDNEISSKSFESNLSSINLSEEKVDRLQTLLLSSDDCSFPVKLKFESNRSTCYGPSVSYVNHPDGDDNLIDGETYGVLPGGDLGMFFETEVETGEACGASQVNSTVENVEEHIESMILAAASIHCVARKNRGEMITNSESIAEVVLPMNLEDGETMDLIDYAGDSLSDSLGSEISVTSASITKTANDRGESFYTTIFKADIDNDEGANEVFIRVVHSKEDDGDSVSKLSSYVKNSDSEFTRCGDNSDEGFTRATSIQYSKSENDEGNNDVKYLIHSGKFCGTTDDPFKSEDDFTVDKDKRFDSVEEPYGWSTNFRVFVANYVEETMIGNFSMAWQAGDQDGASRIIKLKIAENADSEIEGNAYFGFGEEIGDNFDGALVGMYCNWAGPNDASRTLVEKVQHQSFIYNETSELFEVSESNIGYAPTNSCEYDGSEDFSYTVEVLESGDLVADSSEATDSIEVIEDELVELEGIDDSLELTLPINLDNLL